MANMTKQSGSTKHETLGNLLGGLFVASLLTVLCVIGIAPNQANGALRAVAGGSSGGGTVPTATCASPGGILYASAGAITCNVSLTTDGAGAVSASASVTSPIVQAANNLSIRSGSASTDAATVTNNLFTFGGGITGPTGQTFVISAGAAQNMQLNTASLATTGAVTVGGSLTPNQTTGLIGTTTNNNAVAGSWGEFVTSSVSSAGAVVTVSSNTPVTVVSTGATVTAGDYDVQGLTCYISGAATSFTVYKQGIGTTTNTFGALGSYTSSQFAAMVPLATTTSENCQQTPLTRVSLSGTSNVFMVAAPIFSVSGTITAYGFMRLRRVR